MTKDRLGKLPKLGVPKCSFSHSFGFWACLAVPAEQSFSGNVWSKEESLSFNSSAPCELGNEGFVRDKQTLRGSACKWNFKLLPREEKHSRRLLEMQEVTTSPPKNHLCWDTGSAQFYSSHFFFFFLTFWWLPAQLEQSPLSFCTVLTSLLKEKSWNPSPPSTALNFLEQTVPKGWWASQRLDKNWIWLGLGTIILFSAKKSKSFCQ